MVETWLWTPFVFVILIAAISSIDPSVLDAAAIDGAGRIRIAFSIYIPMIKPFLIIALVLRIIDSAKSFDTIQILTQGGPGYDTASFNFLIFKNAIEYLNFGYASAVLEKFLRSDCGCRIFTCVVGAIFLVDRHFSKVGGPSSTNTTSNNS